MTKRKWMHIDWWTRLTNLHFFCRNQSRQALSFFHVGNVNLKYCIYNDDYGPFSLSFSYIQSHYIHRLTRIQYFDYIFINQNYKSIYWLLTDSFLRHQFDFAFEYRNQMGVRLKMKRLSSTRFGRFLPWYCQKVFEIDSMTTKLL